MGVTETKYHRIGNERLVRIADTDPDAKAEVVARGTAADEVDQLVREYKDRQAFIAAERAANR